MKDIEKEMPYNLEENEGECQGHEKVRKLQRGERDPSQSNVSIFGSKRTEGSTALVIYKLDKRHFRGGWE